MMTEDKRKKITKMILDVFNTLDKTGSNAKKYADILDKLSLVDFKKWVDSFRNEDKQFYLEVLPFKNEPSLKDIERAAKFTKTQLHQYIYFSHEDKDGKEFRSAHKVPVGYLHVRRLQQLVRKKTNFNLDISKRNQVTGQLSGASAVGRIPDEEIYNLSVLNTQSVLKELLGPRADAKDRKMQMYNTIQRDGMVSLSDLSGDIRNQPTLNAVNCFLLAAGLKTDLVDKSYMIRSTADKK